MYQKNDVMFQSGKDKCAAYFYIPLGKPAPVIVMAHGLGGVKEMTLTAYAELFVEAGFACFVFDYRNFGASGGKRRQRINVKDQLSDWESAIAYVKNSPLVDGKRLGLLGSSFSGGHVITLSARRRDIKAAVAQCPYTNCKATMRALPFWSKLKLCGYVLLDMLSCLTGYHPKMIKLAAAPNKAALMAVPDYQVFFEQTKGVETYQEKVPARTALEFLKYNPGKSAKIVSSPIYYAICDQDSIAPAKETTEHAKLSPRGQIKHYPCGHFDIYLGKYFVEATKDYLKFFAENL